MWATLSTDAVAKIRASDGKLLGTFDVGNGPRGVAFDGSHIWVVTSGRATKLRASDGQVLGTFPVTGSAEAVAFDGVNIGVTEGGGGHGVSKF